MNCAYVYTNSEIVDINDNDHVIFNKNGYLSDDILHHETSEKIFFKCRGIFMISYIVHTTEESVFCITVNDHVVENTITKSIGANKVIGAHVLQLEEDDIVRLKNLSGKMVTLNCFAGGSHRNVRSSMIIEQIE
jgi:hypothetical protein